MKQTWFSPKTFFKVGNIQHPKLWTIILIVFDFQGVYIWILWQMVLRVKKSLQLTMRLNPLETWFEFIMGRVCFGENGPKEIIINFILQIIQMQYHVYHIYLLIFIYTYNPPGPKVGKWFHYRGSIFFVSIGTRLEGATWNSDSSMLGKVKKSQIVGERINIAPEKLPSK